MTRALVLIILTLILLAIFYAEAGGAAPATETSDGGRSRAQWLPRIVSGPLPIPRSADLPKIIQGPRLVPAQGTPSQQSTREDKASSRSKRSTGPSKPKGTPRRNWTNPDNPAGLDTPLAPLPNPNEDLEFLRRLNAMLRHFGGLSSIIQRASHQDDGLTGDAEAPKQSPGITTIYPAGKPSPSP